MAGQIKKLIDRIIDAKSGGNIPLVMTIKTKLVLKGINPDNFTEDSPDNPEIIDKLKQTAEQMGIRLLDDDHMATRTAYSTEADISSSVAEIRNSIGDMDPAFVLYFASPAYNHYELARAFSEAFRGSRTAGCTTAGELVNDRVLKKSVVAMAFSKEAVQNVNIGIIRNLSCDRHGVDSLFASFESHYGIPMSEMNYNEYVGIILMDGLSRSEERVMDRIGDLTNVTFIGGSAGDDLAFRETLVSADGKAFSNAATVIMLKPARGFEIIKIQSFKPAGKEMKATKVNNSEREVLEFDGKPAAIAYAEALGKNIEEASGSFMHNPLGLMVGDEPYVRSPQRFNGNGMVFYCNVLENMELSILESTDIISDTKKALEDKKARAGSISGIINFNCILRTLELESKGQAEKYGAVFAGIPTVGFSTYGEAYIGHINQTSTILVFK